MPQDPRQTRTREALLAGLIRLLEHEGLNRLSVSALCRESGVHRTTFYGHAESVEQFAVNAATEGVDEVATVPDSVDVLPSYRAAMINLLEHVASRRQLFRAILGSRWEGSLRLAIDERMRHRVRIALDVFAQTPDVKVPPNREELVAFISAGLVGIIALWAVSDESDSEAWASRIQHMMPGWWPIH